MVGPDSTAILNESGLETSSGGWSLHKHAVTPAKPGGGIIHWAIPNSFVGERGSDWVVNTLSSSVWGIWTSPSPELWLWGLCLRLSMEGESAWQQLQVWRDVALSPNQGTFLHCGLHSCVHGSLLHRDVSWCWLGTPGSDLLRSTFSTQNWRAQVYATIFSCWISQISWQAKIESSSGRKSSWQRHSSAGGAWWSFFTWLCSLALFGNWKEASTSCKSFS